MNVCPRRNLGSAGINLVVLLPEIAADDIGVLDSYTHLSYINYYKCSFSDNKVYDWSLRDQTHSKLARKRRFEIKDPVGISRSYQGRTKVDFE